MTVDGFWAKVDRSGGPDACWPWTGYQNARGYGQTALDGRQWLAHRLAFTLARGPIPAGIDVCHTCDTPPCCNPAHHFLGTRRDNTADMDAKGRRVSPRGIWNGSVKHPESRPRGEKHARARLTEALVREIRASRADGAPAIARRLGLPRSTVRSVLVGETWTHVKTFDDHEVRS